MFKSTSDYYRKESWYNRNIFPLVPVIIIKKEDNPNTWGFTFRWLIFTFWTLDSFRLEISACIDTYWGLGVMFSLPYFRGVIAIPCPTELGRRLDRKLRRKCGTKR